MKPFILTLCLTALATVPAYGYRGSSSGQRNGQKESKKADWPGRYLCEQCLPTASVPPTASLNGPPPNGCWKYEITIVQYDHERRGQIEIQGPKDLLAVKSLVAENGDRVEFHFTEKMDNNTSAEKFTRDDILLTLQHREDDYILRFGKIASKIEGATAITCERSH